MDFFFAKIANGMAVMSTGKLQEMEAASAQIKVVGRRYTAAMERATVL